MTLLAIKPTPNLFIPNEELPINQQLGYKNQLLEYLGLNNHCFEGSLFPYLFFGSASWANLSSPSNINPCRISLSIKWAVDGSLPARRDGKFDVRGTNILRSSDFRKKTHQWGGILKGRECFFWRILCFFWEDWYIWRILHQQVIHPSILQAWVPIQACGLGAPTGGLLAVRWFGSWVDDFTFLRLNQTSLGMRDVTQLGSGSFKLHISRITG